MLKYRHTSPQQGQVLLIVILTMVVALTVGLSVVSRSISNLRTSKQNEESQRAFQAAEAGIDQVLKQLKSPDGSATLDGKNIDLQNSSNFSIKLVPSTGSNTVINNGDVIDQNVGFDVWLSDYPDFTHQYYGNIEIHWAKQSQVGATHCGTTDKVNITPAIEVLILSGTKANPQFTKQVFDPCSGRTTGAITAVASPGTGDLFTGKSDPFGYKTTITIAQSSPGLIMKIIPFYNSSIAGVKFTSLPPGGVAADDWYPEQGKTIQSTGKSGDTVRKLEYFLAYPQIPNELFPYSIVSQ